MNLNDLVEEFAGLTEANRPIRVRLSQGQQVLSDVLLAKRVTGSETLCGGLEYRILCVSTRADLPLKEFIAAPAELQFVTDRGDIRVVSGIVAQAAAGQSDEQSGAGQGISRGLVASERHLPGQGIHDEAQRIGCRLLAPVVQAARYLVVYPASEDK